MVEDLEHTTELADICRDQVSHNFKMKAKFRKKKTVKS